MRICSVLVVCFGVLALSVPQVCQGADPFNFYAIGNSLTIGARPYTIEAAIETTGIEVEKGWDVVGGTSLTGILNGTGEAVPYTHSPYDDLYNALPNYHWDTVSMQFWYTNTCQEERQSANTVIGMAADTDRFYVYSGWSARPADGQTFASAWNAPMGDPNGGYERNRATNEWMLARLREDNPGTTLYYIPVGEVLVALEEKIDAGEFSAVDSVQDLYMDSLHLGPRGRYIAAITYAATVYGVDPRDLPIEQYPLSNLPESDYEYTSLDELNTIHETVWEVVHNDPLTGVVPEPATMALLTLGGMALLRRRRGSRTTCGCGTSSTTVPSRS